MKIDLIDADSAYLTDVIQLWRRNSRTLGYFPEGAFREHAAKRCILVAHNSKGKLLGYLMFRIVRKGCMWPQAVVVHLCVDEEHRTEGVARALVDQLRDQTRDHFLKIELSCRRDYDANELWPKLGFVYGGERIGRGGKPIDIWQMELRSLPLIALLDQKQAEHRLRVVLDANVLYRLQDPVSDCDEPARLLSEEAKALEEDWLNDDLALLITDESFNEIQRNGDPGHRAYRLGFARRYQRVVNHLDDVREIEQDLRSVFAGNADDKVESDIRQLAHAIAGGAHFFTTQDTGLLKKAKLIYDQSDIRILSPGELISRIDEMIREVEYHPKDLAGSDVEISKIHHDQMSVLDSCFRRPDLQEKKAQFQTRLRTFIAQPDRYQVLLSQQRNGEPLVRGHTI